MTRQLTLLVPGLLGRPGQSLEPAMAEGLDAEALTRFLNQARSTRHESMTLEQTLFGLFGLATEQPLPIAALTRLADYREPKASENEDGRVWLRADPVHLRADRDSVVLLACADDLSMAEAEALAAQINSQFAAEPWQLETPVPQRWYIALDTMPAMQALSPQTILGGNIHEAMPQGSDSAHWRALINESQMLLHDCAVNQQREQRGALTINSLWFWGGGRLPAVAECPWQQLWADNPLAIGLARHHGCAVSTLPVNGEDWLQQAGPGQHLLVIDDCLSYWPRADIESWRQFIETFSQQWLTPLQAALKNKQLEQLTLQPLTGTYYEKNSAQYRWQWPWLGKKKLGDFLN